MIHSVAALFEKYGRLRSVHVPVDRYTQKNKGFAFVTFEDRREAEDAKDQLDNFPVESRRLRLDWDIGSDRKDEIKGNPPRRDGPPPSDSGSGRYERAPERLPERLPDRAPDRVPDRVPDRAPDRAPERAPERGAPVYERIPSWQDNGMILFHTKSLALNFLAGRDRRPAYEDYGN
ncbi:Serine arginine-rich splicing factor 2 [Nowakowskiella sp. JEL0078]|nr:Serine arginine-rich splicing factor 2 [Nowakowskiella sp. JEL0078]